MLLTGQIYCAARAGSGAKRGTADLICWSGRRVGEKEGETGNKGQQHQRQTMEQSNRQLSGDADWIPD
ncbi:hypothetical protein SRHO_G00058520 [Serrasalmus rhombeus]